METGSRLGPYEILEPLGAGGMGEVFLAQDSRLKRQVAIKVLPAQFAGDPERLARFEQEARAAAALNHPHIAAVHDVGHEPGADGSAAIHYIVQEYLQGDSLHSLLARERLETTRALDIAIEIAEALAAAHAAGIIHRDLKPANVFVTPEGHAKVLDFGLAKLAEGAAPRGDGEVTGSPTILGTAVGQVMGTAGYMAPEQIEGAEVDQRADLFAFGCLLYEMVTGQRAFAGKSVLDTLHRIAHGEARSLSDINADLPADLQRILGKCMAKSRFERYQHADDLIVDLRGLGKQLESGTALKLSDSSAHAAATASSTSHGIGWKIAAPAAVAVLIGGVLVGWALQPAPTPTTSYPTRLAFELPPESVFSALSNRVLDISPDGRRVAFVADNQLWLRDLAAPEAVAIRNTDRARSPTFSPDGTELAFVQGGAIKRVAIGGGAAVTITDVQGRYLGYRWASDGNIYLGVGDTIQRVPATGGALETIFTVDQGLVQPNELLPGNEWLLVSHAGTTRAWETARIMALSLDTGETKTLIEGGRGARYLPTGQLVYVVENVLLAVPFDLDRLEVTGGPIALVEGVRTAAANNSGGVFYAVSASGRLAYISGRGTASGSPLVWTTRDGEATELPFEPNGFNTTRLSPDGTRLASEVIDEEEGRGIWLYRTDRPGAQRVSAPDVDARDPVWSTDGEWIYFAVRTAASANIWRRRAALSEPAELFLEAEESQLPWSASADGAWLYYSQFPAPASIHRVAFDGEPRSESLADGPRAERDPWPSPDGRFVAFQSNESGDNQVYVTEIATGERWLISTQGGGSPHWSGDGSEIFFRAPGFRGLWRVGVRTEAEFAFDPPELLFETPWFFAEYEPSHDGERFLIRRPLDSRVTDAGSPRIDLVLDWFTEVRQRMGLDGS